ncbi:RHS repeat-associated core domain-containing protein [Glycomyces halotolerans]
MSAPALHPLDARSHLAQARRRFAVLMAAMSLLSAFAIGGLDLPYLAETPVHPGFGDPAEGRDGEVEAREHNDLAAEAPVEATWPEADVRQFDLTSGSDSATLGGLPVTVARVDEGSPDHVEVGLLPAADADTAGVSGVLLAVAGDGGEVEVAIDYETMAAYYGGSYGARLTAWHLPDCFADTGKDCAGSARHVEGANNGEAQTLTFVVDTDEGHRGGGSVPVASAGHGMVPTSSQASAQTASGSSTTVMAVAAGESSEQGDYTATALAPSSEWSHGGSSGAFQWSYAIETPPVIGGLAPDITLGYSSQTSDGRTAATNNQGSWIGEGFTYEPGYIERSYQSCADDGHDGVAGAGDQCWAWDNASIVLSGASGDLVKDGDTWRISGDDGSKVERLTGAGNGDNNGEYWKVTTVDGTQYYFGRHKLPGYGSGDPTTNSTWTVPVFGDDTGEPCYDSTFAEAHCDQAWRWNLDYVVDPTGAAMAYYYTEEINHYARHGDTTVNGDRYTRGGYLKRIEYGLREDDPYATAPARVMFTVAERCIEYDSSDDCSASALNDDTASDWPDVPWDRHCDSGAECQANQSSPTFWTRKRLTGITTQVHDGSAYAPVDSWQLTHSFVSNGDLTRTLWLDSITRTGKAGSGPDITLPPTTLLPVQKENRVDQTGDNISPLIRSRLATVYTDTGGQIDVVYSSEDCTTTDTPTPSSNGRRCFPVIWQPASKDDDITDWFHKYVVTEVTVSDRTGESPDQVTRYQYSDPAWRHTQYKGIGDEDNLTWADWRGYGTVTTIGAPDTTLETKQVTNYYQGMHGDDNGAGGTRSVTLTDALGYTHTDYDELSGRVLDSIAYNDGQVLAKTSNNYWRHVTATDAHDWGEITAAFVRDNTTRTAQLKADGTWRTTTSDSDWDNTYGLITSTDDFGDDTTAADNRCTRYEYAHNTGDWLIDYTKRIETVAVKCSATPERATDVISDIRTHYDDGAFGTAPVKGLMTAVETIASHDGANADYVTTAETTYDHYGRALTVTDAAGHTTTTAYTDQTGRNTGQTITNPLGHVSSISYEPLRHLQVATTDANGKTTELAYDALGRLTKAWMPFQNPDSDSSNPYLRFSYSVTDTAPVAVTTEQLEEDRVSYTKSIEIFDGLLRTRQNQATGPDDGRLVTDTVYDALGRTKQVNDVYFAAGAPAQTLLVVDSGELEVQRITEYDDLGRTTATITAEAGQELWRTTTEHWTDQTSVTVPDGGTATTTFTDARGQTTELRQYLDNVPSGQFQATTYDYTPTGDLATVTDFDGNTWSFEYDQRGRKTEATDPDTGHTTYSYDVLGNLVSTTDARGQTVTTVYDELSRPTETWDGDPTSGTRLTRRVYDSVLKGYETGAVSYENGMTITKIVYTRNWDYQPISEGVVISGDTAGDLAGTYKFGTDYYIDGTTKGRTWSAFGGLDAEAVIHERDQLGRITEMSGIDGTYADNIYYEPTGRLSSVQYPTTAATIEQTNRYGPAGRLTQTWIEALDRPGSLTNATYDYDDAGNVLSVVDSANAQNMERQAECYSYDGLRRLTEAWTTAAAGTDSSACTGGPETTGVDGAAAYWQSYTFDAAGNRTSLTDHDTTGTGTDQTWNYTHGTQTAHTLETVTDTATGEATSFGYDQTGNTTSVTGSTGFAQNLTWDATGKIETVTTTGAATSSHGAVSGDVGDGTIEFFYDADGARVMRSTDTVATLYVAGVEITLDKTAGTLSSTRTVALPGGAARVETAGDQAQIQLTDHHGTGTVAFDCQTGEVTRRYSDPYGNNLHTATTAASGDPIWLGQYGFVRGTIDPTGYTHIGARDYNPTTGRFLSVDPIGDLTNAQQLNGYAYSNNSPVTFTDPTGLRPASIVGGSGGSGNGGCNGPYTSWECGPQPPACNGPYTKYECADGKGNLNPPGCGACGDGGESDDSGSSTESILDEIDTSELDLMSDEEASTILTEMVNSELMRETVLRPLLEILELGSIGTCHSASGQAILAVGGDICRMYTLEDGLVTITRKHGGISTGSGFEISETVAMSTASSADQLAGSDGYIGVEAGVGVVGLVELSVTLDGQNATWSSGVGLGVEIGYQIPLPLTIEVGVGHTCIGEHVWVC